MKKQNHGFILFSVLLLIVMVSFLISMIDEIEGSGFSFLIEKTRLFSLKKSMLTIIHQQVNLNQVQSCDQPILSIRPLVMFGSDWWRDHGCEYKVSQGEIALIREPPFVSTKTAIVKQGVLYFAAYQRVVVRGWYSDVPPVFMQAWIVNASTTRVEKDVGLVVRSAGIEGLESV